LVRWPGIAGVKIPACWCTEVKEAKKRVIAAAVQAVGVGRAKVETKCCIFSLDSCVSESN
jgi:hypothetical protein